MKKSLTLNLLLVVLSVSAQDNQWAPAHRGTPLLNLDYIVDFNPERGVAHWVAYELLPAETLGEAKRKSSFRRDDRLVGSPVHKDYTHSGFDRGHLKPAADSKASNERMAASFLMTNVAPQTPQLNRGSWKQLEETTRDWAHELGISYTPSLVFFDAQGQEVMRISAFLKTFHFQSVYAYVLEKAYLEEPQFQRYIAARADHIREAGFDTDIWGYESFHD